jgi:ABC-2 type transport system permease protein
VTGPFDFLRRVRSLLTIELERAWRTRTTWVLAAAMLVVAALVSVGATHQAAAVGDGLNLADPVDELRTAFGGVATLRIFVMLLGVLCVTTEYHHGDIVWRYLAEPSRAVVITAKAVACALIGALLALFTLQISFLLMCLFGSPGATLGLTDGEALQRVAGSVASVALAGVLGVGIGAAVRNQTAAVVGTLIAVLVAEPVLSALAPVVADFLPGGAASAAAGNAGAVGWLPGLALSAGYAAAAAVTGSYLCSRADV